MDNKKYSIKLERSENQLSKKVNYWINTNKQYIDQLDEKGKQAWKKEYYDYQKYKNEYKKLEQKRADRQLNLSLTDDQRQEIRRYQHVVDKAMIMVSL